MELNKSSLSSFYEDEKYKILLRSAASKVTIKTFSCTPAIQHKVLARVNREV